MRRKSISGGEGGLRMSKQRKKKKGTAREETQWRLRCGANTNKEKEETPLIRD